MLAARSLSTDLNGIGSATLAVTILGLLLSGLAVGLRFGARRIKRVPFGLDDWLILLATISYFGFCANALVCVYTLGGGQVYHDRRNAHRKYVQYMQSLFASRPLYIITATPVKLSVCFLYRRLFSVEYSRRIIKVTIISCILWFVTGVISTMLYCRPIRYFWDKSMDGGQCFHFFAHLAVFGSASIIIDTVIIGIAIPVAMGLNMSLSKRVAVAAAFLLSTFILVSGTLRIVYSYSPVDDAPRALLCSVINLGISIICANLATYSPLFPEIERILSILHSRLTDSRHGKAGTHNTGLSGHTRSIYRSRGDHGLAINHTIRDIHPMMRISIDHPEGEGSGIMIQKEICVGY